MNINGKTKLYGIIGNPVSHSLSPAMHNSAFTALGENCVYIPFPVEDIKAAMVGLSGLGIGGVSVTIPHKEAIMEHLDFIDPVAQKIGAVNTVKCVEEDGQILLHGFNTDWLGALRPLQEQFDLRNRRVVILGAGGSARAIGFGLLEAGADIVLCSRTESRGRALASDLGCQWCSLEDVENLEGHVLINATSVGMGKLADQCPVPLSVFSTYQIVMDIVYSPLKTRFLKEAEESGCTVINGLEMLLFQGVAQFELWTGLEAPIQEMRKVLLEKTGQ